MLLLTEEGIIAARDKWGRTPIVIGKKENAYAVTSESTSLPNLDFHIDCAAFCCWNTCVST